MASIGVMEETIVDDEGSKNSLVVKKKPKIRLISNFAYC